MPRSAFLTMENLHGFVSDDELVSAPLGEYGWDVETVSWRRSAGKASHDLASRRGFSGLSDTNALPLRAMSSTDWPFLIVVPKSCSNWAIRRPEREPPGHVALRASVPSS